MELSSPLLGQNQEVEKIQEDYSLYSIYLTKIQMEVKAIENLNSDEKSQAIKKIIPSIEKLGDYLNSLNKEIKHLELNEIEKSNKDKKLLKTLKEIKLNASTQYEEFNSKFLEVAQISKVNNKSSINKSQPQQQKLQEFKQITDNSSKGASLSKDLKQFRNEDLEIILKISNQTMQISQEMKNSIIRADGTLNTIEANVLHMNNNLQNAEEETSKYAKNNDESICGKLWLLLASFILVTILILYIYYKFF